MQCLQCLIATGPERVGSEVGGDMRMMRGWKAGRGGGAQWCNLQTDGCSSSGSSSRRIGSNGRSKGSDSDSRVGRIVAGDVATTATSNSA